MSQLDNDDIKKIQKMITESNHVRSSDLQTGSINKVLTGVCVLGIAWISNGVSEIKGDIKAFNQWQQSITEKTNRFSTFMKEPRFTREDFINATSVSNLQIKINTTTVNSLEKQTEKHQDDIQLIMSKLDIK